MTTRIYQLIAEGAAGYQQARKVGDTPFPFPYVQLVTLLLHAFNFIAPLTVSALINTARDLSPEEAAEQPRGGINAPRDSGHALLWAMAFCVTLGYTALNQVARELEEPFGHGPNHLPLVQLAEEFNSSLVHLLIADAGAKIPDDPFIGADAELLSEEVKQVRRARSGPARELARRAPEGLAGRPRAACVRPAAFWGPGWRAAAAPPAHTTPSSVAIRAAARPLSWLAGSARAVRQPEEADGPRGDGCPRPHQGGPRRTRGVGHGAYARAGRLGGLD